MRVNLKCGNSVVAIFIKFLKILKYFYKNVWKVKRRIKSFSLLVGTFLFNEYSPNGYDSVALLYECLVPLVCFVQIALSLNLSSRFLVLL